MRRTLIPAVVAWGQLGLTTIVGTGATQDAQRIVAIGDVHGAADAFVSILTTAGLIDAKKQWIGGRTILV